MTVRASTIIQLISVAVCAVLTVVACVFPTAATIAVAVVGLGVVAIVTTARARRQSLASTAPWRLELLLLPFVLAVRVQNEPLALLLLGVLLVWSCLRPDRVSVTRTHWMVYLVVVSTAMVSLRGPLPSLIAAALVISILWRASYTTTTRSMIVSIIDGAGIYVAANAIGFYVFGLVAPNLGTKTLALAGSDGGARIFFPLSSSLNLTPAVAAIAAVGALYLIFLERGFRRYVRVGFLLCAATVLVGADGRVSMVVAIFVIFCSLAAPAVLRWVGPVAVCVALAIPFYFRVAADIIAAQAPALLRGLPGFDRGEGLLSILTFNGRSVIWGGATDYWQTFVHGPERWFGFGTEGQYVSGASRSYASVFENSLALSEHTSVHNSLLQQVFDAGIVGAVLWSVVLIGGMFVMGRSHPIDGGYYLAALSVTVALGLSAATEVTLAPGMSNETYWIFVGLIFAVSFSRAQDATRRAAHGTATRLRGGSPYRRLAEMKGVS